MTDFDRQTQSSGSAIIQFWQRLPVIIQAIVLGFFVNVIGIYGSLIPLALIPLPLSIIAVGGVLWVFWKYFSGSWGRWPQDTTEVRNEHFRGITFSSAVWKWGVMAALLFVIIGQASFVLTFRLFEFPAETFTSGYDFDTMPLWGAWLGIIIASLVAGICEETGFRGYMQVPLEKRYGPGVGITIVSILFVIFHLNQAWAPAILIPLFALSAMMGILAYTTGSLIPAMIGHTIIDIFNFSYWWSDVAGSFERRPIAETGLDFHFIAWVLILVAAAALFIWTTRKLMAVRQ